MLCMALDCSFEHLAYMLYLLFQIIWSFCIVIGKMVMVIALNSKATKACSCDFDVMVRIVVSKTIEAQCEKRAIVFYEAWVSSDHEDQKWILAKCLRCHMCEINRVMNCHPGRFTEVLYGGLQPKFRSLQQARRCVQSASRGEEAPCTCQLSEASDGSSNRSWEGAVSLSAANTQLKLHSEL
jgi:hypothetical protein